MKLYLHIGTEKTGSSHLQSMAALNRERLKNYGIFFPNAGKWEKEMRAGRISAGNAQHITDALESRQFEILEKFFHDYSLLVKKNNSYILLLSNELLISVLSQPALLARFTEITKKAGFEDISYLLILRDPVDQALSLYKHRAKGGTISEIEVWPQKHFHYGRWLQNFFNLAEEFNLNVNCRRFDTANGYLETVFFKEWLHCNTDLEKPDKRVNPSLTISELLLLKKIRQQNQFLSNIVYQRLLDLPKHEKASEPRIEQYYRYTLSVHLKKYNSTWEKCNIWLDKNEQICVPEKVFIDQDIMDKVITLSDIQSNELGKIMTEALSTGFKCKILLLRITNGISQLRIKMMKLYGAK